jgi:hypothetical protein
MSKRKWSFLLLLLLLCISSYEESLTFVYVYAREQVSTGKKVEKKAESGYAWQGMKSFSIPRLWRN